MCMGSTVVSSKYVHAFWLGCMWVHGLLEYPDGKLWKLEKLGIFGLSKEKVRFLTLNFKISEEKKFRPKAR